MTRTQKILDLSKVGFSATELSRLSNDKLEKTYRSAAELMKAKQEEEDRVLAREGKHSIRKKQLVAERQNREKIEGEWLRTWKPLPPIRTVGVTIQELKVKINQSREEMEENKRLFRGTGHKAYAEAANRAKSAMQAFQGHLAHLTQEEV